MTTVSPAATDSVDRAARTAHARDRRWSPTVPPVIVADVLGSEYVKLARIKGLPERRVIWRHAFKNAALPVVTFAALLFVALLKGSIIVETVFGWPGLGLLVIEAVDSRDYPIVQAVVLCLSAMYIGVNLLVDVLYAYLNPKIRYGS